MKQTIYLFYLSVIFIVSLLLFQAIFYALGAVLVFIVGQTLIEVVWHYRRSPLVLGVLSPFMRGLNITLIGLALYTITYLPIEFFFTEIKFQIQFIPSWISISTLVCWVIISVVLSPKIVINNLVRQSLLFVFIFSCSLFYQQYHREKVYREYLPKIYAYSPTWGVQGQTLEIKGVNFGFVWQPGSVYGGEAKFDNLDWTDNKLIVQQPVSGNFGIKELSVLRWDGRVSNSVKYEFRDPALLHK